MEQELAQARGELLTLKAELEQQAAERAAGERARRAQAHAIADAQAALLGIIHAPPESLAKTLAHITETAARILGVARASVWRFSEGISLLSCTHLHRSGEAGGEASPAVHQNIAMAGFPHYLAALGTGRSVVADDALNDPRTCELAARYLRPLGIRSMLDTQIRHHGELYGVLCLEHTSPRHWREDEQAFAGALADHIALAIEIQERRLAEEALRVSTEQFRLFMEHNPNIVWVKDESGRCVYLSQSFQDRFGMRMEDCYGKTDAELWPAEIAAKFRQNDLAVLVANQPVLVTEQTVNADGSVCHWLNRKFAFRDAHGQRFVAGIGLDISEQKAAQERLLDLNETLEQRVTARTADLADAMREHAEISSSISHNLRTPLRALQGYATLLQSEHNGSLPALARERIQSIGQNAHTMGRMLDDLLAFTDLYRRPILKGWVAAEVVVQAAWNGVEAKRAGREVELVVGTLPPCEADAPMIEVAFAKLISNALKFARRGIAGRIEVGGRVEEHAGRPRVVYWVKDNGIGFDMRFERRIFELFQRLHWAGDYAGTGCGLALVARIAERHGGTAWAEAVPDQGATFYLGLPGADTSESKPSTPSTPTTP